MANEDDAERYDGVRELDVARVVGVGIVEAIRRASSLEEVDQRGGGVRQVGLAVRGRVAAQEGSWDTEMVPACDLSAGRNTWISPQTFQ